MHATGPARLKKNIAARIVKAQPRPIAVSIGLMAALAAAPNPQTKMFLAAPAVANLPGLSFGIRSAWSFDSEGQSTY